MDNILNDIPVLKTFIKDKNFYCYDTYTNQLLKVSKEVFLEICELEKVGTTNYKLNAKESIYSKIVIDLMDKGFFKANFIKEVVHPLTEHVACLLTRSINQLILEVVEGCNFRCRYCHQAADFKNSRKGKMYLNTAFKSVDFLLEHSKDAEGVSITFYGGEPLLNFEIIKQTVCYANSKFKTKKVNYNITTNASLLNKSIIDFFVENEFSLLISLDGPPEIQNYHRKYKRNGEETFNNVWKNVLDIKKRYNEYFSKFVRFNAVILPGEEPENVISFFEKNGVLKEAVDTNDADLTGIDFFAFIYQNSETLKKGDSFKKQYSNFLKSFMIKSPIPTVWHHSGPCVPGVRRLFIATNGDFYPCEKIDKKSSCIIGSLENGIYEERVTRFLNIGTISSNDCKACWALRFCETCVKECITEEGISYEKKKLICKQIQKKTLTFLSEYIDMNYDEMSKETL